MPSAPVVDIDPDEFWADPYPTLASMRADAPICRVPQLGATLITRRDDVFTCEKLVAVFSSHQPDGLMNRLMGQNMMRLDGEDHRRQRFVYYPAISPRKVAAVWSAAFTALTDEVLEELAEADGAELVEKYATVVSGEALKVLTGLHGVTAVEMDAWSQAMIDGIANYAGDPEVERRCLDAVAAIDAAIEARRQEPGHLDDGSLLAAMLAADMPAETVRANIRLTISGGQNEPRDAIAGAVWALLTHPDQLAAIRSGTVSWAAAFEEYCRWVAPIGMSPRRVAAPHRYAGVDFEPEERVFLMFGSANRDEAHFDDPDRFDITRDTSASLTFGVGPHVCAGAAASRSLVGGIALPRFFERFPDVRLDTEAPPVTFGGWAFRGPLSVAVTWG